MNPQVLILATEGAEGIPPSHIAADIAVPIGILLFSGSVFLLLWSNFGAKKGALIYSTAFFAFVTVLGVMWWFGAPGTPIATGPQNFPGQAPDAYAAKWYAFEPGSARAEFFPASNDLQANFETPASRLGLTGLAPEQLEGNDAYGSLAGNLTQGGDIMMDLFLRVEDGEPNLGGQRRADYTETAMAALADQVGQDAVDDYGRADPFITAALADEQVLVTTSDGGVLLAGAQVQAFANFVNEAGETVAVQVDQQPMFAFQQGSNLWFPSAVFTLASLLLFALSLFGLDRIEQREKKALQEVEEPERLAVPIRQ